MSARESLNLFTDICDEFVKNINHLNQIHDIQSIELEGRLGRIDSINNTFDTNIGEENYNKIKKMLDTCKEWDAIYETSEINYFNKNLRMTCDLETKRIYPKNEKDTVHKMPNFCIEKNRQLQKTICLKSQLFDTRLSLSLEKQQTKKKMKSNFPQIFNTNCTKVEYYSRKKKRYRYVFKDGMHFDLTIVEQQDDAKEYIETLYEFEIELNPVSLRKLKEDDEKTGVKEHGYTKMKEIILHLIYRLFDADDYCTNNFLKTNENELLLDHFKNLQIY